MKPSILRLWIGATLLLAGFNSPPTSSAQDPAAEPPAIPAAGAEAANRERAEKPDPDAPVVERSVYPPHKDLKEVFEKDGSGVFLPYCELLDLWNQLQVEKGEEKAAPPADGILSPAQYTASIDGDVIKIDASLKVESFKQGWAVLPLIRSSKTTRS